MLVAFHFRGQEADVSGEAGKPGPDRAGEVALAVLGGRAAPDAAAAKAQGRQCPEVG
jgi:hypothetical protein